MNRWARVQRQNASPTADLTKSPGGMFHHEGPIRWGVLTRAATTAMRTKKMERQMIPATLSRGETVGGVTMASGAHRNCARAGDHASTQSDPPRHGCGLRLIEDKGFGFESLHEPYSKRESG
jgi:hypothetical protein